MAYLDHNATSTLRPEAAAAMTRAANLSGNPVSIHRAGRAARAMVEDAREQVAGLVGAKPSETIFTSGGTESNFLALHGAVQGALEAESRITRLFVSAIEHDSVLANVESLIARYPWLRGRTIPVTADGVVDTEALRVLLREGKGRALVVVMAANNETGVVQPLGDVARLCAEAEALLFVDAAQAAGKIAVDLSAAHYISLAAHKIGGAHGVGALVLRDGVPFAAQIRGGGQERGLRAGAPNLPGIASFGAAAAIVSELSRGASVLRDLFEEKLLALASNTAIFGRDAVRLPNTSNFAIPGIAAENAVMALDMDGVMISSGAACSSGKVKSSHVLAAMGVPQELAACGLRVSFGWDSTKADVEAAIDALSKLVARAKERAAA